jgi:hypothetical protein
MEAQDDHSEQKRDYLLEELEQTNCFLAVDQFLRTHFLPDPESDEPPLKCCGI